MKHFSFLHLFVRALGKSWQLPHLRIIYLHGVPPEFADRFRELVDYFSKHFEIVPYSEAVHRLRTGALLRPCMAITFDDADQTVYDYARPILDARNLRPCVFAVADYLTKGWTYREPRQRKVMSWEALAECADLGWEVGNHTFSHPNLVNCSNHAVLEEVEKNKVTLERHLGRKIVHFAYPYGQFDSRTIKILRNSGLCETQATTQRGQMCAGHDVHMLRRDRIDLEKTVDQIEKLMRLADRFYWLRHVVHWLRRSIVFRGRQAT
ncbi:MAG: polysaccharide deacetylase family protein [Thermoguttaceae bacterium]|nr:polysaccharide deacetylase family protein [Thermoguttaceae bacterium]